MISKCSQYKQITPDIIKKVIDISGCCEEEESICKKYGWGWFTQGGCHAYAEALQNVFGGELIGSPESHVFLLKDGIYYDADGGHEDAVRQFNYLCGLSGSSKDLVPLKDSCSQSHAVKDIEALIRNALKEVRHKEQALLRAY